LFPGAYKQFRCPAGIAKRLPHGIGPDPEGIYRTTVYAEGTGKTAYLGTATKMRPRGKHSFACLYVDAILADLSTLATGYAISGSNYPVDSEGISESRRTRRSKFFIHGRIICLNLHFLLHVCAFVIGGGFERFFEAASPFTEERPQVDAFEVLEEHDSSKFTAEAAYFADAHCTQDLDKL
jgi:hypothetical protein